MAGAGGDSAGGSGGNSNEIGGAGGAGGEAGAARAPTLAQNCAAVCAAEAGLSCPLADCVNNCTGGGLATEFVTEYEEMTACQAKHLVAADYKCSDQGPPPDLKPFPKADTTCETLICKFTCLDQTIVDIDALGRCGC